MQHSQAVYNCGTLTDSHISQLFLRFAQKSEWGGLADPLARSAAVFASFYLNFVFWRFFP